MSVVRVYGFGQYAAHARVRSGRLAVRPRPPLYARVLRLRALRPGGLLCFLFFEGAVTLGALLGFAELASWWAVVVLPATVAAMVKLNDVLAAMWDKSRAVTSARIPVARGRASVPRPVPVRRPPGTNQRQRRYV